MKSTAKIIGLIGAAIAILWAMRDRLVSIAAPSDPAPPTFRVIPPTESAPQPAATEAPVDDLTEINGIGPVYAARLREAGITSFASLGAAGAARVAEITGATTSRAEDWLSQASARS